MDQFLHHTFLINIGKCSIELFFIHFLYNQDLHIHHQKFSFRCQWLLRQYHREANSSRSSYLCMNFRHFGSEFCAITTYCFQEIRNSIPSRLEYIAVGWNWMYCMLETLPRALWTKQFRLQLQFWIRGVFYKRDQLLQLLPWLLLR